ncbi:MAG: hypothetical protein H0A76_08190 [Candidatus Thiodubiliella endoseptemdiera]|uniref:Uncharacterized protein n=1 Tax=Candidatus Thiodubiliella endoseptemdiera TaxID=2738886 RepID=A0A853F1M7_9GAMM|nr:hypothetical protein [Candidatus Thiodubiliella endoseptemdiera]
MLLSAPVFIIAVIQVEILPKVKNAVASFVIKDANIYTTEKLHNKSFQPTANASAEFKR